MKKTIIHLFAVAAIGLALTACGGHRDHDKDGDRDRDKDNQEQSTTVTSTTTTTETKTEKHTGEENKEHKETPPKSEVPAEKGTPKVDTTLQEKPKDESTMGTNTTKHHVKPGGVH